MVTQGQFLNFFLPYQANGQFVSPDEQAGYILNTAQQLLAGSGPVPAGIAITYSANSYQTQTIEQVYGSGGWKTGTDGANQAAVMASMENLMGTPAYAALQGKVHIAPITTIYYGEDVSGSSPDAGQTTMVTQDLARIGNYLKDGWYVLGWENEDSVKDPSAPYAVGGGVASSFSVQQKHLADLIQQTLLGYAKQYPGNAINIDPS